MSDTETELQRQIEVQAEEIERLKDDLQQYAYVVSHDFSAPIRQIGGFVEMIHKAVKDQIDEKTQGHFDFVNKAVASARTMLEATLLYSRIESQAQEPVAVNLKEVAEKVIASLDELISAKNAQIELGSLPEVTADQSHMKTLLSAIIENALLFQPEGNTPKISISSVEVNGGYEISVADNGIGLGEEETGNGKEPYQKLFVPLRKGRNGSLSEGPGIGLALAKRIMHHMGGNISISGDESGTTVRLLFLEH